jgi:putative transposase
VIQCQLKIRPNAKLEARLDEWLWSLTGVYNWAIRKIEQDGKDRIYYSAHGFQNILANHGRKIGIPGHCIQGVLATAHTAWVRCYKKLGGKPRLKGRRRPFNSIPFPDPIRQPESNYINLPGLGLVRFHKQEIPEGRIKCGRLVKRASGWYLCLFIEAERIQIERKAWGKIGIDPGFKDLLTFSSGEKIVHPKELQAAEIRLAQAQRGRNRRLTAKLHERLANKRTDRNHKLSLIIVQENSVIAFSKDNHCGVAKRFGKSVTSSGHAQLRMQLAYKSLAGGTRFIEVPSKNSTRTCSECGCLSGPTGLSGLAVRQWRCPDCGSEHDRDVNAARNTLLLGMGSPSSLDSRHAANHPKSLARFGECHVASLKESEAINKHRLRIGYEQR